MKKRGVILSGSAVLVIAAALFAYLFMTEATINYEFETTEAEYGSINNAITATGTLEATNTVEVGTQVSGVIEKLYVDFNSEVKAGQLIAELDKSTLLSTLDNSKASLDKAEADLEYKTKTMERMQKLYDKQVLAQSDYDEVVYNYKISQASLKSAKAEVERSERNLSYASIYSPIDGIVLNRAVEQGQTVAASMNTPELYTIVNDLSEMQVEADVDEADIGVVKEGQNVDFTVDAFSDDTFKGRVSEIRLQPNESSNVITYTVIIAVANPEHKLKPGMTASITAYVEEAENVLLIAAKALRFMPDREMMQAYRASLKEKNGNASEEGVRNSGAGLGENRPQRGQQMDDSKSRVWRKVGDILQPVVIEVGISDGTHVEVLSGLSEGDKLVISMSEGTSKQATESSDESEQTNPFMQTRPNRKSGGGGPH